MPFKWMLIAKVNLQFYEFPKGKNYISIRFTNLKN